MLLQSGDQISFVPDGVGKLVEKLPQGVYYIQASMEGVHLAKSEDFVFPHKIYNLDQDLIDRALSHNERTHANTGVLLLGIKGSGKSLLAKQLCMQSGKPVINFTHQTNFNIFSQLVRRPELGSCAIFMDEFDKVFNIEKEDAPSSDALLSLMDGQATSNHLFVLTSNSDNLSPFFFNRPGRIRYIKRFGYLTAKDIKAVAEDLLVDKSTMHSLLRVAQDNGSMTYDILTAIIGEMNFHRIDAVQASRVFNYGAESFTLVGKVVCEINGECVEYSLTRDSGGEITSALELIENWGWEYSCTTSNAIRKFCEKCSVPLREKLEAKFQQLPFFAPESGGGRMGFEFDENEVESVKISLVELEKLGFKNSFHMRVDKEVKHPYTF